METNSPDDSQLQADLMVAKDVTALVERYRPLVQSVCRRYLRQPDDVADAVQETLLKLVRNHAAIHGEPAAWLAATAASTSLDFIRRIVREQRRRDHAADLQRGHLSTLRGGEANTHEAIEQRLAAALAVLDEPTRTLLMERFFCKKPLRVIADDANTSIATMSRRVHQGLEALSEILRHMGVEGADDIALAEHFGQEAPRAVDADPLDPEGLRFARDWRGLLSAANPMIAAAGAGDRTLGRAAVRVRDPQSLQLPRVEGWSRPIRVGGFVSYASTTLRGTNGIYHQPEEQVWSTRLLLHPGFELVGIAEPGTTDRGGVERTLRDYDFLAGLIDSTDAEALKTLDVILLGLNWAIDRSTTRAFEEAVRSGVGLLNEYWTGMCTGGNEDEHALALMLADSPYYGFHHGRMCAVPLSATVHERHPLLPACTPGDSLMVSGCGPVYHPAPGARVLISKDWVVPPEQHRIPGLGPARMPVYVVGQLGRGRVAVVNVWNHGNLARAAGLGPHYFNDLLAWLAEPHRELL